jgi:hypothetical protein
MIDIAPSRAGDLVAIRRKCNGLGHGGTGVEADEQLALHRDRPI